MRISLLVVLGLLIAPVLTVALFHHLIDRQNAIADEERVRQAHGLLAFFSDTQDVAVADNANWDEAYRKLVIEQDYGWFQRNIGAVQFGTMPHDAAAITDAEGNVLAGSWLGKEALWDPGARIGSIYGQLIGELRADSEAGPRGSFVRDLANVGYIAMSELLPETGSPIAKRRFLIFHYHLDTERMNKLREILSWDDLKVSLDQPVRSSHAITDAFGDTVGHLGWDYPKPGSQALREMGSLILLSLILGIASILGLFRQVLGITQRLISARREALDLANSDPLTGVANRRLLRRELGAALATGRPFQLFIIDLDGFKAINDNHGHRVGDAVLVELSARMVERIGAEGMLARMGGDEFAAIRYGPHEDGAGFGAEIMREIAMPIEVSGQTVTLSASIGMVNSAEGLTEEEMIRRADVAMYAAKTELRDYQAL